MEAFSNWLGTHKIQAAAVVAVVLIAIELTALSRAAHARYAMEGRSTVATCTVCSQRGSDEITKRRRPPVLPQSQRDRALQPSDLYGRPRRPLEGDHHHKHSTKHCDDDLNPPPIGARIDIPVHCALAPDGCSGVLGGVRSRTRRGCRPTRRRRRVRQRRWERRRSCL